MNETAEQRRDKRLRRLILLRLNSARLADAPLAGWSGEGLFRATQSDANGIDQTFDDEDHAMTLITDLRDAKLIEVVDRRRSKFERYWLPNLFLRITDKGSRLLRGEIEIDPSVEDDRIG